MSGWEPIIENGNVVGYVNPFILIHWQLWRLLQLMRDLKKPTPNFNSSQTY